MRFQNSPRLKATRYALGAMVAAGSIVGAAWFFGSAWRPGFAAAANAATSEPPQASPGRLDDPAAAPGAGAPSIELTATQLATFKIGPVGTQVFPLQDQAFGSIDFNENMETQVFTNYQGRIVSLFAKVGDDVQKGQKLFTIDSPDLVQAESTLISTAGVLRLTTRALDRAKDLYSVKGLAQKDYDQAVSDQQGAEGN